MLKRFMRLSRRRKLLVAAAVVAFLIVGMARGCGAYQRPPALTAGERALVDSGPLPYSVTVAWWDDQTKTGQSPEAYSRALAKLVMASGAAKTARCERSPNPSGKAAG